MANVSLDQTAVQTQLADAANALMPLDAFYGMLACLPANSQMLSRIKGMGGGSSMSDNGEVWHFSQAMESANRWFFGTNQHGSNDDISRSGRQIVIDLVFGPFDPENADPNCIEPIGELSALEKEIGANDGSVTDYQRQTIIAKLQQLNTWMQAQERGMGAGFEAFKEALEDIEHIQRVFESDNQLYALWLQQEGSPLLKLFVPYQRQIIDCANDLKPPYDTLSTNWSTLIGMVGNVADRVKGANLADIHSLLQEIDLDYSLKAWPILCSIASGVRPTAFRLPPAPAGFE